jgi:hypothetical protein
MNRFFDEYWMFASAMLERSSDLLGIAALNRLAAGLGYPFGAALALTIAGVTAALLAMAAQRPGWGLIGLAVGEELSALSLASAALVYGWHLDAMLAVARVTAAFLAACLICALLRRSLKPSSGKSPAAS